LIRHLILDKRLWVLPWSWSFQVALSNIEGFLSRVVGMGELGLGVEETTIIPPSGSIPLDANRLRAYLLENYWGLAKEVRKVVISGRHPDLRASWAMLLKYMGIAEDFWPVKEEIEAARGEATTSLPDALATGATVSIVTASTVISSTSTTASTTVSLPPTITSTITSCEAPASSGPVKPHTTRILGVDYGGSAQNPGDINGLGGSGNVAASYAHSTFNIVKPQPFSIPRPFNYSSPSPTSSSSHTGPVVVGMSKRQASLPPALQGTRRGVPFIMDLALRTDWMTWMNKNTKANETSQKSFFGSVNMFISRMLADTGDFDGGTRELNINEIKVRKVNV